MPEEQFEINLLRFIAAELYAIAGMQISREMLGKSYFSLGVSEKSAVDQMLVSFVGNSYQSLTPELLRQQKGQQGVGFQGPASTPEAGKG